MPVLTDEIKEFIVKALACYDRPTRVVDAVQEKFDIVITRQQVYEYDPTGSRVPAERWRDLHAATRAAFLEGAAEISVTHKLVRLRILDRLVHECERNNVALALAALERAAKECGGMYENRRPIIVQMPMPQPIEPEAPKQVQQLASLSLVTDPQPLNANRQ
jgi:hypothetical protein